MRSLDVSQRCFTTASNRTLAGPATRLKFAPYRVLNTPERQKIKLLAKSKRNAQAKIRRLISKIDKAVVDHDGVAVEPGVHEEIRSIVK